MRPCSFLLLLATIAALVTARFFPAAGEPVPAKKASPPAKSADDWKKDPVCRMVFFAVLEGLYTDGVSRQAVDSVVGGTKGSAGEIRQTFVIECPLCHPVYEAFRAYQQRPAFRGKGDTLGKGLEAKLERGLRDKGLRTRQGALQTLVHRWVQRRLAEMRLSAEEKRDWAMRLEERSRQGDALLARLKVTDRWYGGWGYGFCAACRGCTAACGELKSSPKK
jgi:hypothetical protein